MDKEQVLKRLEHIRDFQINDLKKADQAGANFLVCVGCFNATEILGGIKTGYLGKKGHVADRLRAGLDFLGTAYKSYEADLLELRNSMTHAYLGKTMKYSEDYNLVILNYDRLKNNISSKIARGLPAIFTSDKIHPLMRKDFVVNTSRWIEDLEAAWDKLLNELKTRDDLLDSVATALEKLPELR